MSAILDFVLFCCTSGINSGTASEAVDGYASSAPQNSPLCRLIRNLKRFLQEDFKTRFNNDLQCGIELTSDCQAVSCFPDFSKKSFSAGFRLHLCDQIPSVDFWVDSTNSTSKWSHTFKVLPSTQRVSIDLPTSGSANRVKSVKWYLSVNLRLNHSRVRLKHRNHYNYVTLNATFEAWPVSDTPLKVVLVNDTRFQLSQLCDLTSSEEAEMLENVNLADSRAKMLRALELTADSPSLNLRNAASSRIGQRCDQKSIFQCGVGATCTLGSKSHAVCECLPDYTLAANGTCIRWDPMVNPTVQPLVPGSNSTYSSALGAVLSILTLVAVAVGVFFISRHRIVSRLRSRIPLQLSFWPFRRGSAHEVDDQVDMVDPFAHEDDDPPLI